MFDSSIAKLEANTASAVTPLWAPAHGCGAIRSLCGSLFGFWCKDIDGARQGPFKKDGTAVPEISQPCASGFFMLNSAAFAEIENALLADGFQNAADYGFLHIDLAAGAFLGSFGFTMVGHGSGSGTWHSFYLAQPAQPAITPFVVCVAGPSWCMAYIDLHEKVCVASLSHRHQPYSKP